MYTLPVLSASRQERAGLGGGVACCVCLSLVHSPSRRCRRSCGALWPVLVLPSHMLFALEAELGGGPLAWRLPPPDSCSARDIRTGAASLSFVSVHLLQAPHSWPRRQAIERPWFLSLLAMMHCWPAVPAPAAAPASAAALTSAAPSMRCGTGVLLLPLCANVLELSLTSCSAALDRMSISDRMSVHLGPHIHLGGVQSPCGNWLWGGRPVGRCGEDQDQDPAAVRHRKHPHLAAPDHKGNAAAGTLLRSPNLDESSPDSRVAAARMRHGLPAFPLSSEYPGSEPNPLRPRFGN
jgi:hypothetical protein